MEAYRRYGRAVHRKCVRILGNAADADDVVQALFLDLHRKGPADADLPYLYRAATNRCLNRIRDHRRRAELLEQHGTVLQQAAPGAPDTRTITLDLLARLTAQLDAPSSEILVYRYLDQMTGDEIAALIGTSRRTVTKRLGQIRALLGELDPNGGTP